MDIKVERSFRNPNGKTRRVEEHFDGFSIYFKKEGEAERLLRTKKEDLPFDASLKEIEKYIENNTDLSLDPNPAVRKLKEELEKKEQELLSLWDIILFGEDESNE